MCTFERLELDRSFFSVPVGSESVSVKIGSRDGRVLNVAPEHDDCAAVGAKLGLAVKDVFAQALVAARTHLENGWKP